MPVPLSCHAVRETPEWLAPGAWRAAILGEDGLAWRTGWVTWTVVPPGPGRPRLGWACPGSPTRRARHSPGGAWSRRGHRRCPKYTGHRPRLHSPGALPG